jgi:hypothetical protein
VASYRRRELALGGPAATVAPVGLACRVRAGGRATGRRLLPRRGAGGRTAPVPRRSSLHASWSAAQTGLEASFPSGELATIHRERRRRKDRRLQVALTEVAQDESQLALLLLAACTEALQAPDFDPSPRGERAPISPGLGSVRLERPPFVPALPVRDDRLAWSWIPSRPRSSVARGFDRRAGADSGTGVQSPWKLVRADSRCVLSSR